MKNKTRKQTTQARTYSFTTSVDIYYNLSCE